MSAEENTPPDEEGEEEESPEATISVPEVEEEPVDGNEAIEVPSSETPEEDVEGPEPNLEEEEEKEEKEEEAEEKEEEGKKKKEVEENTSESKTLKFKPSKSSGEEENDDEEEEEEEEEDGNREKADQKTESEADADAVLEARRETKKKKHSMGGHFQAELNKQKIQRLKQERENRRSELDTHHMFLIEIVAFHLDLKPKDVEEFIIDSPTYLVTMEKFFEKKGRKSLIFVYQDDFPPGIEAGRGPPPLGTKKEKIKRLMVTDGTDIPLKGICMYFIRTGENNKINIKNIADEVFFGILDIKEPDSPGIALESVHDALKNIYFKNLRVNTAWMNISDPEMAQKTRLKFLTSIEHYSDFLGDSRNDIASRLDLKEISDMEEVFEAHLKNSEDILEASRDPEIVAKVEHTVMLWCKNFEKVLKMSKQMRKESDNMGPYAELSYWRNLMAKMSYIIEQVQQMQVQNFIQVLMHAKSRVLRRWKDVDTRVTDEFHEAKDNVRYMYALEKFLAPLYQTDPPGMIEHINSLMYVIRTIFTASRYYNTCEKVTALMVKISNQMISACRRYLTQDDTLTVWNQSQEMMQTKLNTCIELYERYRGAFEATKLELATNSDGKQFNLSESNIFGRFEQFCDRLKKIYHIVEIFNLFQPVHDSHIDGLVEVSVKLKALYQTILENTYDPLDFRRPHFDDDFVIIRNKIDEIQISLEAFLNKSIDACPNCISGLTLLERFKKLRNPCLDVDEKSWYLFQFYHNEIDLIGQIYEAEKNETPIPRGFPPFGGKMAWARHLYKRLERPMKYFEEKTEILKREDAKSTIKHFNATCKKIVLNEILVHESFVNICGSIYEALEAPILVLRGNTRQELVLNFDPFFRQLVDETEIIRKLGMNVPEIAQIIYYKQDQLFSHYDHIKSLLDRYLLTKAKAPQDLSMLLRPLLKKVERAFMPGVTNISWVSLKAKEFFDYIETYQKDLENTIKKVQEVLNLRINQFLYDISHTLIIDFPEDKPMAVQDYMDHIKRYGVVAAKELEYKSRRLETGVTEMINMLLRTADMPTPIDNPQIWLNPSTPIPLFKDDEHIVVEKPPPDPTMTYFQMSKEEQVHMYEECRNVFNFYNQKCIEALQKTTRISLDILRQRTEEPQVSKRNPGKTMNRIPLLTADLILTIPTIQIKPGVSDLQQILNKSLQLVTECLKRVMLWGQKNRLTSFNPKSVEAYYQEKSEEVEQAAYPRLQADDAILNTTIPLQEINPRLKNSYKPVMEYKDISKMVLMMQTVVLQARTTIHGIISSYNRYSFLWKETRDQDIKSILDTDPIITEVESIMKSYTDLEEEIELIPPSHRVGPLDILTAEMKTGFLVEVKEWKNSLCRQMGEKYRVKALEVEKFIDESMKDLNTNMKDFHDTQYVMTCLQNIRSKVVDMEMIITPVEECYNFLSRQNYSVTDEESNRADTLRLNFNTLLQRAQTVQNDLWAKQAENKKKLNDGVNKLKNDIANYANKYNKQGPMVEGIAPQTASDRLMLYQDEFDELWERYLMYNAAEKLFGIIPTEYPELMKFNRELSLLQKLYGLFNDVMRAVAGYSDVRWNDLKVPKINQEILEFQKRCNKLPTALKTWPAYDALKQKIEDFSKLCPLLELLTNKAMRDRHWDRIGEICNHSFSYESETFSLKHVMEAPLLKNYEEVEDVAVGAQEEREMELKLKQMQIDWSVVPIHFAHFKNRGELLVKEDEMRETMGLLTKAIADIEKMLANKYHVFYKKELQSRLADYSKTLSICETWLIVQDLWVEMDAVFVGGDIARNIPIEAKRFNNSNRNWVKVMQRARENPLIVSCCISDEFMAQILPHLKEQLEMCKEAVVDFVEKQRILAEEEACRELEKEEQGY